MARRPVDVNHKPRISGQNGLRVQAGGQQAGDMGRADVVGDVAFEMGRIQAQLIHRRRHRPPGMVADQLQGGLTVFVDGFENRRVLGTDEGGGRNDFIHAESIAAMRIILPLAGIPHGKPRLCGCQGIALLQQFDGDAVG